MKTKKTYEELEKKCEWETKTRQKILKENTELKTKLKDLNKAFDIMKRVFS